MGVEIKTLPLVTIDHHLPCVKPGPDKNPITENSPALEVMTDFSVVKPVTIESFNSLDLALEKMKTMGVRFLLITDDHDNIQGVVTSYDIQGEKPVKYAGETKINYKDINVSKIMTPIAKTPAVDFEYARQSLVRHVINTIKDLDIPHILVVEKINDDKLKIRGMFSSSQIGKALGKRVYEPLHASRSLAEIRENIN